MTVSAVSPALPSASAFPWRPWLPRGQGSEPGTGDRRLTAGTRAQTSRGRGSALRPGHRRTPSLPWVPGPLPSVTSSRSASPSSLEVGGSVTETPALNAPRLHLPHAPSPTRWALGKAPATTVASGGVQHPQPSVPASALTFTRCPNADATFRPYENGVHVSHHLNFVFPRESM